MFHDTLMNKRQKIENNGMLGFMHATTIKYYDFNAVCKNLTTEHDRV